MSPVLQAAGPAGCIICHRIVGAVLVYLLIAVGFACLFTFLGLSIDSAFRGIATLTTSGCGDIVPVRPWARNLCNVEAVIGQLYPATLLARLVTLEPGEQKQNAER